MNSVVQGLCSKLAWACLGTRIPLHPGPLPVEWDWQRGQLALGLSSMVSPCGHTGCFPQLGQTCLPHELGFDGGSDQLKSLFFSPNKYSLVTKLWRS